MTAPYLSSYARRSLVGDEGVRRSPVLAVPAAAGILGKVAGLAGLGKGYRARKRGTGLASRKLTASHSARRLETPLLSLRSARLPASVLRSLAEAGTRPVSPASTRARALVKQRRGLLAARRRQRARR